MPYQLTRGAGLTVLCVIVACHGAKTDQPVETTSDAGTSVSPSGDAAANRGTALVRFVNALPTDKAVDVTVEERPLFNGVNDRSVTQYSEVSDNLARFTVRGAGKDSTMAENREMLTNGFRYTLVALPAQDGAVKLRVFRDEVVPDSGKARVRVIHAAPGMDDVKVTVAGSTDPLFNDVDYGSEAGFKDINPGTISFVVRRTDPGAKAITLKPIAIRSGHAYTILLKTANGKLDAMTFEDKEQGTTP